jgi:hypothetical protein
VQLRQPQKLTPLPMKELQPGKLKPLSEEQLAIWAQ